jgi:8-oxo-dGTP diphosphatase
VVAACAYVENAAGEILLVRTSDRPHTWEMPGGQLEAGESLTDAVRREVEEETGMRVVPTTLVGVYENVKLGVMVAVFRARLVGGELRPQPSEILETAFIDPAGGRLAALVTSAQARTRIADARRADAPAGVHEAYTPGGPRFRLGPGMVPG